MTTKDIGQYFDTWHRSKCPSCSKLNWISDGNLDDFTQPDLEVIICWSCGTKFWWSEEIKEYTVENQLEEDEEKKYDIDEFYAIKGSEHP